MNNYFYRAYIKFKRGSSRVVNGIINCNPEDIIYVVHTKCFKDYSQYCEESGDNIKFVDITTIAKVS